MFGVLSVKILYCTGLLGIWDQAMVKMGVYQV